MRNTWQPLHAELDIWQDQGQTARFWLRDDDAIAPTPALDRLIAILARHHIPVLLAIIPKGAGLELAARLAGADLVLPCQHGFSHRNHASPGEKPQELGLHRGFEPVLADLRGGRDKLLALFGNALRPVLVPPWNRIDPALVPHLAPLGITALSTFGEPAPPGFHIDANVDIIDWRASRSGHAHPKLVAKLVEALVAARKNQHAPVGILAHHLVHGERAWSFLEWLGESLAAHPAALWVSFDALAAHRAKS